MAVRKESRSGVPLRALPVERMATADALTLRRGCTTVRIDGEHAPEIVGAILDLAGAGGMTEDELVGSFPPETQESIRSLVGALRARRLLLPTDVGDSAAAAESPLDVFYWHFGLPDEPSPAPPGDELVVVAGRNRSSARLCELLDEAGFQELVVVDDDAGLDGREPAVVAAVSESGFGPMRAWNELALERDVPFLPVVIDNLVAYVGPLVVPYETACLECFLRRRYSNLDESAAREAVELSADGAHVVGLHPAISAVAAGAAALELSKFFIPWRSAQQAGYLLTFNLLASRSGRHRVLKVPRCPGCSSLGARHPVAAARLELTSDAV